MPHIHTGSGQHDLTASAFIVRTDGKEPRVLLHMHKKLNRWLHMGGHVELHENPWQAVIHEIREESGYELDQLELLQPRHTITDLHDDYSVAHPLPCILATHPYGHEDHFHTDMSYVFVTAREPRHRVGKDESNVIRLFTKQEIKKLSADELYQDMRVKLLYVFDHLLKDWQPVNPRSYGVRAKRKG